MQTLEHRRLSRSLLIASFILLCLFTAYVTSYIVYSRRAFSRCEAVGFVGFYFIPPENTDVWRIKNYGCVLFYYPLIVVDEWIGTGKGVAWGEPLWGPNIGESYSKPVKPKTPTFNP